MIYRFILVSNWKFWLLHKIWTIFGPLSSKKSEFGPKKKIRTIVAAVLVLGWFGKYLKLTWTTEVVLMSMMWHRHCCHNGPNFLFKSEFGLFVGKGSENGPNFVQKSEFWMEYKNEPINHLLKRIFIISFSPKKKHINLSHFIT